MGQQKGRVSGRPPREKPPRPSVATPREKGRRGRPCKPPEERQEYPVTVRLTATERAYFEQRAATLNLSAAEILRRAGIGAKFPDPVAPVGNRELWLELGKIGGNLNQFVRAVNEGRAPGDGAALLRSLSSQVSEIRKALLGVAPANAHPFALRGLDAALGFLHRGIEDRAEATTIQSLAEQVHLETQALWRDVLATIDRRPR